MCLLNTETNVALFDYGSTVLASSSHELHPPHNVLLTPCKHLNDKWASHPAERGMPHWLIVDFGKHLREVTAILFSDSTNNLPIISMEDAIDNYGNWYDISCPD